MATFTTGCLTQKIVFKRSQAQLKVKQPQLRFWRLYCAAPAAEVATKQLLEINKDNFYEYIGEGKNGLVVVDFFTDWCGPCKLIYPSLVEMNEGYGDAVNIVKFNCNAYNKDLGKELKIRVAPTFHLYKAGEKVAEMSGANLDRLKDLIEKSM
eukprot:TRINITY_DN23407_c0_g1_i1.p1 TRINITY_DN23407_c0_g1~~TRINITY_DN23407_c0_g1_i1.p1  ORF type:complete len:170 (+),score=19.08 TRINITY_DN23407_c0_g1_i1:53-511(+)